MTNHEEQTNLNPPIQNTRNATSGAAHISRDAGPKNIAILATGGTITKTYNQSDGTLSNQRDVLEMMLASLLLENVKIDRIPVMSKDSLEMTDADHEHIAMLAGIFAQSHDGVIVVHGTDRLTKTGDLIHAKLADKLEVPIVLTGAMRPYELRTTDAIQNVTESILAVQLLQPAVYCVMHSKVLRFPGIEKDHTGMTFRYTKK